MKRLKILYVVPFFPFPPHGGGPLRVSNIATWLSQKHSLHLIALDANSNSHKNACTDFPNNLQISRIPHHRSRLKAFLRQLRSGLPYEVALFANDQMKHEVLRAIRTEQPDVILCSRLAASQYIPIQQLSNAITVLDQHDLSRYLWKSFAQNHPNLWKRWYARFNLLLVKNYELQAYRKFKVCISVSEEESRITAEFCPRDMKLLVVPNGVDTNFFAPQPSVKIDKRSIVLTGTMNQERNVEAAVFLYYQILPLLWQEYPDLKVYIAGRKPARRVLELAEADHRVIVTGEVEDIRPYIARATVVVAPYQMGSGVKHKIPIALSMGKPVVATPNACQGLDVKNGHHLLIAHSVEDFAMAVLQILKNPNLQKKLSHNARTYAVTHLSWSGILTQFEQDLTRICLKSRIRD